jgi:hypothetical protein
MTTLYVDNIAPNLQSSVAIPGHVVQVVQDIHATQVTNTSNGVNFDIGLSVTLTPSSTSSKILLFTDVSVRLNGPSNGMGIAIFRDSTKIFQSTQDYDLYNDASSSNPRVRGHWSYIDSPSSASSITYTVYGRSYEVGGTIYVNNSGQSMLTAMEIAG